MEINEQVYYDGIKYNSYKELAEYLDVSIEKVNKIVEDELYHGKPVTKYMLKTEVKKRKAKHVHIPGEPLIPHPVTVGISTLFQ
jgi:(2Fe-2S) ferredoxin